MAAAMIVGAVYNLINAGFIGSLHDTSLLAAITFGAPLLGLVMAVGGVFGVGGGALISRLLGAAEREPAEADQIKHVSSFAVWGSVLVGAVLGGLGLLFLEPLVTAARRRCRRRTGDDRLRGGHARLRPRPDRGVLSRTDRAGRRRRRQVMIGLIASTVANVVFDVLFILVLHWGVAGAALAMGLAERRRGRLLRRLAAPPQ